MKLGPVPLDAVIATRTTSHTAYAASTELNPAAIKSRRPGSPMSIRMDASSRVAFSNVAADEPNSRRTNAAKSASHPRHSVASVANSRIVPCSLDSTNAMTSSRPATCEYSVAGEIPRSSANPTIVKESKPSRTAASTMLSRPTFGGRPRRACGALRPPISMVIDYIRIVIWKCWSFPDHARTRFRDRDVRFPGKPVRAPAVVARELVEAHPAVGATGQRDQDEMVRIGRPKSFTSCRARCPAH